MSSMPFEEKHRPDKLAEVAGNHKLMAGIISEVEAVKKDNARLKDLFLALQTVGLDEKKRKAIIHEIGTIKKHKPRHKLFTGDAGCGKTTTALAMGKEIFGKAFHEMFKEFNGSDDRTITFVRDIVKGLTSSGTREFTFVIIFLDEVDGMQKAAQEGLRRIIELSQSALFILACNDLDKVIDALKSRCTVCRFLPPAVKEAVDKMQQICKMEGITASDEVLEELYLTRFGDLRNAIGRLGELSNVSKTITVEMLDGSPVDFDVFDTFYSLSEKGQVRKAYRHFLKSRIDGGFTQEDFAATFAKRLLSLKVDDTIKSKVFVFIKENRIGNDSDVGVLALASKIYLSACELEEEKENGARTAVLEKAISDFDAVTHEFESFKEMLDRLDGYFKAWEKSRSKSGKVEPPEPL